MPFKSQAQRAFMYSQHPKIAAKIEGETPKGKKLPMRIGNKGAGAKMLLAAKSKRLSSAGKKPIKRRADGKFG